MGPKCRREVARRREVVRLAEGHREVMRLAEGAKEAEVVRLGQRVLRSDV
jgi:hypothetical protein